MRNYLKLFFSSIIVILFLNNVQAAPAIDSLESLKIGGVSQWIYITGKDTSKPILLVLHGGPGFAMMPLFHEFNSDLEDHFLVVNWDQRGAGLSYSKSISKKTMTLKQFVADAHELTGYLKTRFHQPKIYLLAHSSGTMIAIKLITQYPSDYYAYMGVGQVVNFARNEIGSYNYVLNKAATTKNTEATQELQRIGPPNQYGRYKTDDGYDVTEKWIEFFGGDLHGKDNLDQLYDDILYVGVYEAKKVDQLWWDGLEFSQALFDDPAMTDFNAETLAPKISIPVYFLSGKYDYDTPVSLVKEYYTQVKAPKKAFFEFENSAHFPFYEEPSQFDDVLINKILPAIQAN